MLLFVGLLTSLSFMVSAYLHAFRPDDHFASLRKYGEIVFLRVGVAMILYFEYLLHK